MDKEIQNRFSKENIEKLVVVFKDGPIKKFLIQYFAVPIIDFLPFFATIGWFIFGQLFKIDQLSFLSILFVLETFSVLYLFLIFVRYYFIKVNHYKIPISGMKGSYKFVFISDIHIGKAYYGTNQIRLKRIINKLNSLKLELNIIGGDFFCYKIEENSLSQLKNLTARYKIGVYGNHDSDYLEEEREGSLPIKSITEIEKAGIDILLNEGILIDTGIERIFFAGIPDLYSKNFNLDTAFKNCPPDAKKILISHNPDIIDFIKEEDNIDLILSGHTHSGMMHIKPFGAILPMPTKYRWLTKGIFQINNKTKLFLSQGIGYSTSRLRLGTENEICVVELVAG